MKFYLEQIKTNGKLMEKSWFFVDSKLVKTFDELVIGLRQLIFGPNDIIVPNHSIGYLLVMEVLNPFYIFQVASVILWTSDEYYYYAAAIVLMSVSGIVSSVYQTKQVRFKLPYARHYNPQLVCFLPHFSVYDKEQLIHTMLC